MNKIKKDKIFKVNKSLIYLIISLIKKYEIDEKKLKHS